MGQLELVDDELASARAEFLRQWRRMIVMVTLVTSVVSAFVSALVATLVWTWKG